ncbi:MULTISPECIES: tyrosine-type recombinase/integrase [Chryseobacterium]|uniref:Integrase n=1 Tax=Chryseobacterium camelliae TaxID=1265445 RepID=A0ABU0TEY3_9FLAO|nr:MULTISPECIES: tyrosine-type recombinase/integrase [Chryseobacterium]MDT3406579.1 integrase [Pseudacidovorax intermedius]MDQ1095625.1 integrase [Chryseobacterium camelliae]MDQ1099561.1 integrase [Chryseobacterium sp. SORGH_AS_1048]MDR6086908.1 integrase [Chryseobacterium sp. SORGH_AS_0909]MDR6131282.1 integrase [Chryseobacterium sp. SORGH_AS_1175]
MNFTFYLPETSKDSGLIYLHLLDESFHLDFIFCTGITVAPEEWNVEKGRPKNIYLKKNKNINTVLDRIKVELAEYIRQRRTGRKAVTKTGISKKLSEVITTKPVQRSENSFLNLTLSYITARKEIICHSTYKRYLVFFRLLQRFEGFLQRHLLIEDIDAGFVRDFLIFGKEEEYSENTLHRTVHFVRTILNFVERKGIATNVRELEIRREKQSSRIIILTESEIATIKQTEVPEEYETAKKWLLISCYTGQRISDFMVFHKNQLSEAGNRMYITFVQQKTQKEIILPLHPVVLNILKKNNYSFPDPIDHNIYNRRIRKIAKLAGINEKINARKRTGHRSEDALVKKWEVISSHIGRRSFASNFYGKIPTPLLMQATGHSTEKMFLNYINHNSHDRLATLGNYFDQLYRG